MEVNLITEPINFIVNMTAGIITVSVLAYFVYKPAQKFLEKRHQLEVDASEKIEIAKVVLDESKAEQAKIYAETKEQVATDKSSAAEEIAAFKAEQEKAILEFKQESKEIISKKQEEELAKVEELIEGKVAQLLEKEIVKIAQQTLTKEDIDAINEELVSKL